MMMKYAKYVCLIISLLLVGSVRAQWNYVVDVIRGDSTALVQRVKSKDKNHDFVSGDTVGWLHNGDTVLIALADSGFAAFNNRFVTVTVGNGKYFLDRKALAFDHSMSGQTDWVNQSKEDRMMHSEVGHIYMGGTTVYWVILALFLVALLLALVGESDGLLLVAALVLLVATVLEVYGFYFFKNDLLWWLDKSLFSFWKRMLYALILIVGVVAQLWTMRLINAKMGGGEFAVWIPSVAFLAAGIIDLVATLVLGLLHVPGHMDSIIFMVALALFGLIAFLIIVFVNVREIGGFWGTVLSLFSMLWGLGVLASVVLLVVTILRVFWAIILVAIGVLVLLATPKADEKELRERRAKAQREWDESRRIEAENRQKSEEAQRKRQEHLNKYGW